MIPVSRRLKCSSLASLGYFEKIFGKSFWVVAAAATENLCRWRFGDWMRLEEDAMHVDLKLENIGARGNA